MSLTKRAPSGSHADKLWRDALRRQVLKRVGKEQNLDRLAVVVFAKALDGDMAAAKEIGDRLDGRAAQSMTIDATIRRDPSEISDAELAAIVARLSAKSEEQAVH